VSLFPAFLKLEGRAVLVVGGGGVALSKLDTLLAAGARVTVVAPSIRPEFASPSVEVRRRAFRGGDLDGAWFVVAAAPPDVNRAVERAARDRRVFVNAVDDPDHASAYLGSVLRRAGVTVSISTNGDAPALAALLRECLDWLLPADLDRWMAEARTLRRHWRTSGVPMALRRPQLARALLALYGSGGGA
jgi:uroporphyrin-III C-methyltransferase/precorrin-2 dehydrogenase/sirohydrochlorin ferrochelatase